MRNRLLLSRRSFVVGAAASALPTIVRAAPPRIATIDWAVLETLLAIGTVPVAAAELILFRKIAVTPELPPSVADIGLRGSPNYEALRLTRPDLILSSNYYTWAEAKLRMVAPVETISVYATGRPPFEAAEAAALTLAALSGRPAAGQRLVEETHAELVRLKDMLSAFAGEPVIPINFGDPRHFRVFGADSVFGGVIERLGLRNAWTQSTRYAATAPVGLEELAGIGDAWIIVLPPVPPDAMQTLANSAFWSALPSVQRNRVLTLAPVNPFGALPAALRFAGLLVEALTGPNRERGFG